MRIAICEDELHHLAHIDRIVRQWAEANARQVTLDAYPDAEAFLRDYERGMTFDLVFLDIKMGEMNGIELARVIRRHDKGMMIVFVTNFRDYVFNIFDLEPLNYLIKPVKERECADTLGRAAERLDRRRREVFVFMSETSSELIPKADIHYFEVQRHYVTLKTARGAYRYRGSLRELEADFGEPRFFKCHRSYLVNLEHVYRITQSEVILTDETVLPISRKRWAAFNECFLAVYVKNESADNSEAVMDGR